MIARDYDAWHAYLRSVLGRPHDWGTHDCVKSGFASAKALVGRDLLAELGSDWTSHKGALRVLSRLGGLEAGMDRLLPRTPCAHAHRGDLGMVMTPDYGPTLVVIEGPTLCAPGPRGLQRLNRAILTEDLGAIAWSLG